MFPNVKRVDYISKQHCEGASSKGIKDTGKNIFKMGSLYFNPQKQNKNVQRQDSKI